MDDGEYKLDAFPCLLRSFLISIRRKGRAFRLTLLETEMSKLKATRLEFKPTQWIVSWLSKTTFCAPLNYANWLLFQNCVAHLLFPSVSILFRSCLGINNVFFFHSSSFSFHLFFFFLHFFSDSIHKQSKKKEKQKASSRWVLELLFFSFVICWIRPAVFLSISLSLALMFFISIYAVVVFIKIAKQEKHFQNREHEKKC